eukprot:TRINITY_DN14004_c0_g1_i2.p1 TRINITY_DN14004_c0_g1~~TRINITY_DN14004_c0_g1_i2.p1  ORF type:complete len:148 (-),score=10.74 TRINITY_DN14004_c0_g1_i2:23-466(-)
MCRHIADKTVSMLFGTKLSIKKLALYFARTSVTDAGIAALAKNVGGLKNLTSFNLVVWSISVTDVGLANLADELSKLKYLTTLDISIGGCNKVTDQGADILSNFLKSHPSIIDVGILMPRTGISENGKKTINDIGTSRPFTRFNVSF